MFFAFHDDVVAPTYVEELVRALAGERAGGARVQRHDRPRTRRIERASTSSIELEGITDPVERGAGDDSAGRATGGCRTGDSSARRRSPQVGGIHPNEQGEYSADWTWLLGLSLVGEFVRVPDVLCDKYYTERQPVQAMAA